MHRFLPYRIRVVLLHKSSRFCLFFVFLCFSFSCPLSLVPSLLPIYPGRKYSSAGLPPILVQSPPFPFRNHHHSNSHSSHSSYPRVSPFRIYHLQRLTVHTRRPNSAYILNFSLFLFPFFCLHPRSQSHFLHTHKLVPSRYISIYILGMLFDQFVTRLALQYRTQGTRLYPN